MMNAPLSVLDGDVHCSAQISWRRQILTFPCSWCRARAFLLVAALFALTSEARADLQVCNRTKLPAYVATLQQAEDGAWVSEGWWTAPPNECTAVVGGDLARRYYYIYAARPDGAAWGEPSATSVVACIKHGDVFKLNLSNDPCEIHGGTRATFIRVEHGESANSTVQLNYPGETIDLALPDNKDKVCKALYANLSRPRMRSQKIKIAHYTDLATFPQLKSECTNVYDTGVPDPSTCTTKVDPCGEEWHTIPGGPWGCVPTTSTSCTNMKACNTYANYKSTMECDIEVQLKLPDFIEKPLEQFVDNSLTVIDKTRAALPLACAPADIRASAQQAGESLAKSVTQEIQHRIQVAIEREARQWVQETAITTIAASIPSGGTGGVAAMGTAVGKFIYSTYEAIKPIVQYVNDAKDIAEDMGFSTSCGWSPWHQW